MAVPGPTLDTLHRHAWSSHPPDAAREAQSGQGEGVQAAPGTRPSGTSRPRGAQCQALSHSPSVNTVSLADFCLTLERCN